MRANFIPQRLRKLRVIKNAVLSLIFLDEEVK